MVWTGKHSLDLQVSVPSGRTAEAIKPDVVALANAIIAKPLRRFPRRPAGEPQPREARLARRIGQFPQLVNPGL